MAAINHSSIKQIYQPRGITTVEFAQAIKQMEHVNEHTYLIRVRLYPLRCLPGNTDLFFLCKRTNNIHIYMDSQPLEFSID